MKGIKDIVTKERVDTIIEIGRKGLNYAIPILGVVLFSSTAVEKLDVMRYNTGAVKYDDAVRAIMRSSMFSEDKSKAVAVLRTDANPDFYRAVIDIVNSPMWSEDKLKTIDDMCKNEEK